MSKSYVTGFARIGEKRELKFALESYWSKKIDFSSVETTASELKKRHYAYQKSANIDYISCNDFSYYDLMLDMAITLGAIPKRFQSLSGEERYFAMARGSNEAKAMEMTKWFNTNYHYIVPELSLKDSYSLDATKIINEYKEAKNSGVQAKINLIGPITFLGLSKRIDGGDPFELFAKVLELYKELISTIASLDEEVVVQIDEPIFVTDLEPKVLSLIKPAYDALGSIASHVKIALVTYFEHANEATKILVNTPIWAIGLDFIYGEKNLESLEVIAQSDKTLICGVIDGRNIWRSDIDTLLALLNTIAKVLPKERLIVSTSCSLLHVPFSLKYELKMDSELKSWLSYGVEKLLELELLSDCFFNNDLSKRQEALLEEIRTVYKTRQSSSRIHNQEVSNRLKSETKAQREGSYEERIALQHKELNYEPLATTTIGSFPQTPEIRQARRDFKAGIISQEAYTKAMREYIDECIAFQEEIGLDVLVHGEPERNDMVEYFGEQLDGYGFSQNGWVQSYGSRCVKPPFIYGDISRSKAMTLEWITYAQSKTDKIMKGMLTGPVTILNWSFVRNDIPRSQVAKQIALGISDEVDDLQNAGIKIIQVDEAAFKEGYPLRRANIATYEKWAVDAFRRSVSSAKKQTQIHTHMCYSEFNDIIATIEAMDADVISIETARSGNALLKIFKEVGYKQEVGPGVYDIHSPRIPSVDEMVEQIHNLLEVLPKEQLWINPDCGLKTRKWEEVKPSLKHMVEAVKEVRASLK